MTNIQVKKRNGKFVNYDKNKLYYAIKSAMLDVIDGYDEDTLVKVVDEIEVEIKNKNIKTIYIEDIQDIVENILMKYNPKVAKVYILYRNERARIRNINHEESKKSLLSPEFISKYKHIDPPMTNMGMFVYFRTYSRFINTYGRRERWWETCKRAVDYNTSLDKNITRDEAEQLFHNMFYLKQFLSGRTLWMGGSEISNEFPMANYNCSFKIINSFESFCEIFYLLMLGSGAGIRVLPSDVNKLPKLRSNVELSFLPYEPVIKEDRKELSNLIFDKKSKSATIEVGDSKEGWVLSLKMYFDLLSSHLYKDVDKIFINFNSVRPKGEVLKRFGGTASGHHSIKEMFRKINKIINKSSCEKLRSLNTIDCLDIANIIGENVVSGGVRRTSEIMIIDKNDKECVNAKQQLYTQDNSGNWEINKDISHRQMSNNSILFFQKPTRDELKNILNNIRYTGEPGFINAEAASKRRDNFNGVNPCGEILLDDRGLCNLTTVNVMSFVEE